MTFDAKTRKRMGIKASVVDLVADSIQREFANMPHLRIIGDRMMAESIAWVAVRRLRRADRETGWSGRRVVATVENGLIPGGTRGVITMSSSKRLAIRWEGHDMDIIDKKNFKRMAFFAGSKR